MSFYSLCMAYQELGKPQIKKAHAEALFSRLKEQTLCAVKSNVGLACLVKDGDMSRDYLLLVEITRTENPDVFGFAYERSPLTVESQNQFC